MINGVVHHFGGLRSILSSVFLEPIGSPKGKLARGNIHITPQA